MRAFKKRHCKSLDRVIPFPARLCVLYADETQTASSFKAVKHPLAMRSLNGSTRRSHLLSGGYPDYGETVRSRLPMLKNPQTADIRFVSLGDGFSVVTPGAERATGAINLVKMQINASVT